MRNLTLAIDEEILLEARKFALERNTTVNQLVRDYLASIAGQKTRREAARQHIRRFMHEKRVEVGPRGKISWTRDELHER